MIVDLEGGSVENRSKHRVYDVEPLPPHIMAMIRDGGLLPHLKQRLHRNGNSE
jgi:3-isopropylmalate/(R)-2-methylmalate dehydratase small subunit